MSFKKKIYNVLVAKQPPIRRLYVRYKESGKSPLKRAFYLFGLNFCYYILGDRELSRFCARQRFLKSAESALRTRVSSEELAERLAGFEAVSFDIFDTLIFRPFAQPADLFHIVGAECGLMNFAEIRVYSEHKAREKKFSESGSYEVTYDEIYDYIRKNIGESYYSAKQAELDAEMNLCFANSYMKSVWDILKAKKARIVVVSDMYLSSRFLQTLLEKNGFSGFEKLFVSNVYSVSKNQGGLYETVRNYLKCVRTAHIGDNSHSDVEMSGKNGFTSFHFENPNFLGNKFRPVNMSRIIGSAYRGLVNVKFHGGAEQYSMLYEYGYAYSGIFTLGFCNYIHGISETLGADKVLFLARDGDLLKRVYDGLFSEEHTEYFLWSRRAAVKLCFEDNTYDFIRRFVYHKADGSMTAKMIFEQMELSELFGDFPLGDVVVTNNNYRQLAQYIIDNKDKVLKIYEPQITGAKRYFSEKLGCCKKVLAVDIGWAGSGGAAISSLAEKWGFDCDIIGVIACTNDRAAEQPDCSEALLQSGKMFSYCYSQSHNRELYTLHDSARGDNIYFEMLLGSESASLKGFNEDGSPIFGERERESVQTVRQIHSGALDFISDYTRRFKDYPYMLEISGSDAYAPFGAAVKVGGKYFGTVLGKCSFSVGVGTEDQIINKTV